MKKIAFVFLTMIVFGSCAIKKPADVSSATTIVGSLVADSAVAITQHASRAPRHSHYEGHILVYATDSFQLNLRSDEMINIEISGDGDTDLEAMLYDIDGNKVADYDEGCNDYPGIRFIPPRHGKYILKVKNLGNVYNRYTINIKYTPIRSRE